MADCKTIRRNIRRLFSPKLERDMDKHIVTLKQVLALHDRIWAHMGENRCICACWEYYEDKKKRSRKKRGKKGYVALAL